MPDLLTSQPRSPDGFAPRAVSRTEVLSPHAPAGGGAGLGRPDFDRRDWRALHRVLSDARRGVPVVLEGSPERLVVAPAETLSAGVLDEIAAMVSGPLMLIVSPARAEAVLAQAPSGAVGTAAVALKLSRAMLDPQVLRGLADPTADQLVGTLPAPVAAPRGAEATLILAKLARLLPAMVAAALPADAQPAKHLLTVAEADVLAYRPGSEAGLLRVAEARIPLTEAADTRVVSFREQDAGVEHLAILVGRPELAAPDSPAPLARIHSECFTGDLLGSLRCDCGAQLHGALRRMADEGAGVLLYMAQEGRGIGLANKLRAYALQDRGLDTLDANQALGWGADERDYAVAAAMLRALGLARVRLLTNNPRKVAALARGGVTADRVSHRFAANGVNDAYLAAKISRLGHLTE